MKSFIALLSLLLLLTGCTSNYAWKDQKIDLKQRKLFYVESELSDGKNLHLAIAEELRNMGYKTTSGYLTMMPREADTLVSFQSRWTWDFTNYLIELNIQVRDPYSGKIIASAGYHRPAIGGTSTDALIRMTLSKIFSENKPEPSSSATAPAVSKIR